MIDDGDEENLQQSKADEKIKDQNRLWLNGVKYWKKITPSVNVIKKIPKVKNPSEVRV